ncbi:MAG: addiction module protein [Chloroflexi bacterium]|nr:addiction module protein [Chloroflexota bacterium]
MEREPASLLEEALKLPQEARAALVASLLESLDETIDADAEAKWAAEISWRTHGLDSGAVQPVPWPEARRIILER